MLGTLTVLALALQPADTTRASREAFTLCLRTYIESSLNGRMALDAFLAAYPQQCTPQQAAYRAAVIARERAARISQADAEESATMEIDDARLNFRERFEMALPPAPAPAAGTPAPAAAATTPAPAPAAPATTPPPTPR